MNEIKQVMFVCTQNTCRSPMAEYIFKDMARMEGLDTKAISRGMYYSYKIMEQESKLPRFVSSIIDRMSHDAKQVLIEYNAAMDVNKHIAKMIQLDDILSSDIIFTMDTEKKTRLLKQFDLYHRMTENEISAKVFTLKEYAGLGGNLDITDPMMHHSSYGYDFMGGYGYYDNAGFVGFQAYKPVTKPKRRSRISESIKEYGLKGYRDCRDEITKCVQAIINDMKDPIAMAKKMSELEKLAKENPFEDEYPWEQTCQYGQHEGQNLEEQPQEEQSHPYSWIKRSKTTGTTSKESQKDRLTFIRRNDD